MESKKLKKASLENKRGLFIQLGMVVTLSLILVGFEWTSPEKENNNSQIISSFAAEDEMIITRRIPPPESKKIEMPKVAEILDIVDDDIELEDFDFDTEVDDQTNYSILILSDNDEIEVQDDTPFIRVENMPKFNGGDPSVEFRKYIQQNLRYPEIAAENGISGLVIIQFTVDAKGKVIDPVILRSVDAALDKEAIRVVTSSPPWTAGKQRGKAVKVLFTFPINFVLR